MFDFFFEQNTKISGWKEYPFSKTAGVVFGNPLKPYFCRMNSGTPIKTNDGSHTLFNDSVGEHYHSVFGAGQESEHIFIRAGLEGKQNFFQR